MLSNSRRDVFVAQDLCRAHKRVGQLQKERKWWQLQAKSVVEVLSGRVCVFVVSD